MAMTNLVEQYDGVSAQAAAVAHMRAAANVYASTGDEGPLRDAARAIAADAAARGLRAEELVIAFKQLWMSTPELSPVRRRSRTVVDELVTICINEYYRRRASART
jgi:hypothetical protein